MGKTIALNRKACHDYTILETMEAGICLQGTEVKSIRLGKVNLKDSFALIKKGELFIDNMHISPYDYGNINNHDPLRKRKLLMHKKEIDKLFGKIQLKGLTLVPLKLYFSRGLVKLELGLAKGKKLYDKRQAIAKKNANRNIQRALREKNKYVG